MNLFVVLGEHGEYSDRVVWVSGVYLDREVAEEIVDERMAIRREWDMWSRAKLAANREITREGGSLWHGEPGYDEWRRKAEEWIIEYEGKRPEPEYERAERCEIIEVESDVWNQGTQ